MGLPSLVTKFLLSYVSLIMWPTDPNIFYWPKNWSKLNSRKSFSFDCKISSFFINIRKCLVVHFQTLCRHWLAGISLKVSVLLKVPNIMVIHWHRSCPTDKIGWYSLKFLLKSKLFKWFWNSCFLRYKGSSFSFRHNKAVADPEFRWRGRGTRSRRVPTYFAQLFPTK